jgi:ligand-binding SRPBCC domain-containing protein
MSLAKLSRVLAATARPREGLERLERETIVPASLDAAFAFFADAANLEWLTPPWLHLRILTARPLTMRSGLEIEYRIRVYGLPVPWRSRIDTWEPGVRFVDRQVVGPYLWWRHEHCFEPADAGTRVIDRVEYCPRVQWLTHRFVRRDVTRIFDYRERALLEVFHSDQTRS